MITYLRMSSQSRSAITAENKFKKYQKQSKFYPAKNGSRPLINHQDSFRSYYKYFFCLQVFLLYKYITDFSLREALSLPLPEPADSCGIPECSASDGAVPLRAPLPPELCEYQFLPVFPQKGKTALHGY